jgi:hypothetical protein
MRHAIRWRLGAAIVALAVWGASAEVDAEDRVVLDVEFKLTDLEYRPLPKVPVRLVLGTHPDWQGASAGVRFVTDAVGGHRFTTSTVLDKRARKRPTNFVSSLVSGAEPTDHLMVAAELGYMTFRWLYAVDVYRFARGGDVLLDGFSVYTPDARGAFTRKAKQESGGWMMSDLGGLALTHPGHEPSNFMLEPDPADPSNLRWRLRIAFKRSPDPVRR